MMLRSLCGVLAIVVLAVLIGCGGGASGPGTASGRAIIRVAWPEPNRLIPLACKSIKAVFARGSQVIATKVLPRPPSGVTETSTTFVNLQTGSLTLTATAYPNADGTGTAQATGAVAVTILSGVTARVALTMGTTIDHLEIAPSNGVVLGVGQTLQLTTTGRDLAGNVVLIAPTKILWSSSNTSNVSVNADGLATGKGTGPASITATDSESGKTVSVAINPAETFVIGGRTYQTASPRETLTVTFEVPDGGVTLAEYHGYVLLNVSGVGQSYDEVYNDAFYLYTGIFDPPLNGWDGGYYQIAFSPNVMDINCLSCNVKNYLVGSLPPYNPLHSYKVLIDTRMSTAGRLHFGVSDGGFNDNTGAFTVSVTQLELIP